MESVAMKPDAKVQIRRDGSGSVITRGRGSWVVLSGVSRSQMTSYGIGSGILLGNITQILQHAGVTANSFTDSLSGGDYLLAPPLNNNATKLFLYFYRRTAEYCGRTCTLRRIIKRRYVARQNTVEPTKVHTEELLQLVSVMHDDFRGYSIVWHHEIIKEPGEARIKMSEIVNVVLADIVLDGLCIKRVFERCQLLIESRHSIEDWLVFPILHPLFIG